MKKIKIITLLVFLILCHYSNAQSLDYHLLFDGIGDNREFFSVYADPETILGSRFEASLGVAVDNSQRFQLGASYFYEFGSEINSQKPQLLLYYEINQDVWSFKMGAFPRNGNVYYPHAIVSEKYGYYNPTVDGLLVSYKPSVNEANVFVDWVGRLDSTQREQFMAGFFGKQSFGIFHLEQYWYMFHNAHSIISPANEHIEDYMGLCVLGGYEFSDLILLDKFVVKTGVLGSAFRNRGNGSDFDINIAWYSELLADYHGFGVEAFAKLGDELNFFLGDDFYNNAKNYVRLRMYCTPFKKNNVEARFYWSLHIANGDLDNQQQFRLIYRFNDRIEKTSE